MYAYIVEDCSFEVIQGSFDGIQGYAYNIFHICILSIYGGMYIDTIDRGMYIDRSMRMHILERGMEDTYACTDML